MDENFLGFLSRKRRELRWTVAQLAAATTLSHATLTKYLSGEREIPDHRALVLRTVLTESDGDRAKFDALYAKSRSFKRQQPVDMRIEPDLRRLCVLSLDYPPFAGNSDCFLEGFLKKLLDMCLIKMEIVDESRPTEITPRPFDMLERLRWIKADKAQLLFNLITPARMKELSFAAHSTPIRVSINAVIFEERNQRIYEARDLLVSGKPPGPNPFTVIVVRNEVAAVFMEQSGYLKFGPVDIQETLDPKSLAKRMNELRGSPVMLVVDEHTALGVIKELGGSGELVLSPNSDYAVINSAAHRKVPSFYFGIGLKRDNNWPLINYFNEAMATYIAIEPETIAAGYAKLYSDLVKYLSECLTNTVIYVGGLRRIHNKANTPPPFGVNAATWERERKTLVEQAARAVARRRLSLSQYSLDTLPHELASWRPILMRASQWIRLFECGDRDRIRNIIIYCARMATGRDPLDTKLDPISLLQELANENIEGPRERWKDFLTLLSLELDMNLIGEKKLEWSENKFQDSGDLGEFVSIIQDGLERLGDPQIVPTVRSYRSDDEGNFEKLIRAYSIGFSQKASLIDLEVIERVSIPEEVEKVTFVAYSLGELVGFIQGAVLAIGPVLTPSELAWAARGEGDAVTAKSGVSQTMRVDHLFVSDNMHQRGISRRLIKKLVEYANRKEEIGGIWLKREDRLWTKEEIEKFVRVGFAPLGDDYLWYEFMRPRSRSRSI